MIANLPASLFKYFGPDRLDVISNQLLRYTPLGDFNDPFEGRPEITSLTTNDEAMSIFDAVASEELENIYNKMPKSFKETTSYTEFLNPTRAKLQIEKQEILNTAQSFTPMISNLIHGKLDENLGVLCFSEVPDSLLMWAHYGSSHTGFVLEFDSSHSYFHQQISSEDELRQLRRVTYKETRPSNHLGAMSVTDLPLVKSEHWAYEREWRMMRPLVDATKYFDKKPYPVHLYSYPAQALKSIIIGARATQETIHHIQKITTENSDYSHIKLKKVVPDASHFLLNIIDIQPTMI